MLLVVVTSIFALCIYMYIYIRSDKRLLAKIPGPKAWPVVGNALSYVLPPVQLFSYLRYINETYQGINQVYSINMQAVNIYDPNDIEILMSSPRFNTKKIPYTFIKPWLCDGLLVSNGGKWRQRRKLLTKAFHFNILKKYMQTFTGSAKALVNRIAEDEGHTINILPVISETTLDVICETTMGISTNTESRTMFKDYFDALHGFGQIIAERICKVWLYFDFVFMCYDLYAKQKQVIKTLHDFTMTVIKERKEGYDYKGVIENPEENVYEARGNLAMLDLLLHNEREGLIDLNGIREEVDTFMFEGHDTIATAISFFVMRIANEPVAQDKIIQEMQYIFGDSTRSPTIDDLNEMKYLECCIKESLRLYPSVPFITRYLTEEVTLSGYKVPRGTICQIHIFDLHRCKKIYPNPQEFIPERFLPENLSLRHPYAYIPFSAGPRNCIGQKFAMLEMKALISTLLRNYRFEPVTKPQDLVFKADIVLRTNHPIFVRFCARK